MNEQLIKDYLINNQEAIKEALYPTERLRDSFIKTSSVWMHDWILEEYWGLVRNYIVDCVTKSLAVSPEDVIMVLESIDLGEYLK